MLANAPSGSKQVLRHIRSGASELAQCSMWIAARTAGAHTTPVYVKVDGRRFWRLDQVEALVARRLDPLVQIEKLPDQDIPLMRQGNWDNPAAMKESAAQLRKNVTGSAGDL